jgi:hypothetical protein
VTATGSELQTLGQVHRPVVQHLGDPFPSVIPAGQPLGPSMGRAKTEDDGAEHNGSEQRSGPRLLSKGSWRIYY